MNFLTQQIKTEKLLSENTDVAKYIEEKKLTDKMLIRALTFDCAVYPTEEKVKEYLAPFYSFNYAIKKDGTHFLVDLISENQVDLKSECEIELKEGVWAIISVLEVKSTQENTKQETLLSSEINFGEFQNDLPVVMKVLEVVDGVHESYGRIKVTAKHLINMEKNFREKVVGVDLAINEDHSKRKAFGWFQNVFLSGDRETLYAQVIWNSKGAVSLREKEYRYFSPEFIFNYSHPHSRKTHGATLLGGALTNYPFLKMEALMKLDEKETVNEKEKTMEKTESTIELSVHNEQIVELSKKNGELQNAFDEKETRAALLEKKVGELEAKLELNSKLAATEKLFSNGLINAAQKTSIEAGDSLLKVMSLGNKINEKAIGTTEVSETVCMSEEDREVAKILGLADSDLVSF